jgi:hypothetical protein
MHKDLEIMFHKVVEQLKADERCKGDGITVQLAERKPMFIPITIPFFL